MVRRKQPAWFHLERPNRAFLLLGALVLTLLTLLGCSSPNPPPPDPTPTKVPLPTFTPPPPRPTETRAPTRTPGATATSGPTPTPTLPANLNPLTGLLVNDPALLKRRPILVRIGNDEPIRPQSGLAAADLVYEDIMDGWWVTRLTAVYLSQDPEVVGPVRSARLVNLELVPQFDGALAHSGASDPIRWLISQASFVDLDEFFHPEPYWYIKNADWRGRLFTGLPKLREYLRSKGLEKPVNLRGFHFSALNAPAPKGKPATEVNIPYPQTSVARWTYDPGSGRYLRFVHGVAHTDAVTGQQLSAANVIVFYAEHQKTDIVEDVLGSTAIRIVMMGKGRVQVFRDGVMVEGTWERTAENQLTEFKDAQGQPLELKPGNSWIEILPTMEEYRVTFR